MSCPIPVPTLIAAIAAGAVELAYPDGSVVRRPRYLPRLLPVVAASVPVVETEGAEVVSLASRRRAS